MNDDENRKRGYQDDYDGAFSSKRAALGSSSGGTTTPSMYSSETDAYLFKLLCPQSITGLIIGRKGAIINQLNQSTGAKIRLSQNNEFFPGTNDRILLINGTKDCIANALTELVTRIADAPDKKNTNSVDMYGNPVGPSHRGSQGAFQIRVLIPKIASAAIIGRKGAVIQRMGEQSNCKFQLGDEADPYGTRERILIINSGSVENLVIGSQTLMAELLADPRIRTYPNTTTNYSGGYAGHAAGGGGGGGVGGNGGSGISSPGMNPQGGYKPQTAPAPYPSMASGPPPLLPLLNPYGGPPTGYGMPTMPPNQYMTMPAYNPQMQQQMPPMGMPHHPLQHPGVPQPHMYQYPHQQQYSISPNGLIPAPNGYGPGPVNNGYPGPPMQQDGGHHQQQYQMQPNMMMPNNMYGGHMNGKK